MNHGHTILSWLAPEYIKYKKTYRWYVIAGAILLTIIVYGILTKDIMLSLVFLIFAGVYFLTTRGDPKLIQHKITTLGIQVDDKFYDYSQIASFHIVYDPPYVKTLNIYIKKKTLSEIVIQLGDADAADVKEVLLNRRVEELEDEKESLASVFTRMFRL